MLLMDPSRNRMVKEVLVSWTCPPVNWVKINYDGSVCSTSSRATCGGLLRDHHGHFIGGYAKNFGVCIVMMAMVVKLAS
ncbi:putative non-LTR retroelement reverse transcriptase [Sesbania bispinosa]|nr:putative non-LTR retroelement reverse transcriptase [Sesbania bispinosa]